MNFGSTHASRNTVVLTANSIMMAGYVSAPRTRRSVSCSSRMYVVARVSSLPIMPVRSLAFTSATKTRGKLRGCRSHAELKSVPACTCALKSCSSAFNCGVSACSAMQLSASLSITPVSTMIDNCVAT